MLIPYPYSLCSLYIPRPGRVLRPLKYCHVPKAEAAARLLGQLLDDTEPCRNQLDVRRWAAAILLIQMFLCCYVVPKMHIGWFPLIQDVWGCFRMLQDVSGCSWYLFFIVGIYSAIIRDQATEAGPRVSSGCAGAMWGRTWCWPQVAGVGYLGG